MKSETLLIGEAGVNHNGSEELAIRLADLARQSNVDIVKYQIFNSAQLVTEGAPKANYQSVHTGASGSQREMLRKLELSLDSHKRVALHCKNIGIDYMATAFDLASLRFLAEDIEIPIFKISSGDLTNAPFLLAHTKYKRKLIVSTGMSTLGEIEDALGVLAFGLLDTPDEPSVRGFRNAYLSDEGQEILGQFVTLLHCTTEYPAAVNEINMKAMKTMSQAFGLDVGFSDHSIGNTASVVSVALGAKVIEKHFTLDQSLDGPDHKASMSPDELMLFVSSIRQAELCLGSGVKRPANSELANIAVARRSLVATADIKAGELFTESNVGVKRPGTGVSPFAYWEVLSSISKREYSEGDLI